MESAVSAPADEVVTLIPRPRSADFEDLMLPYLGAAYNLARWLLQNEHDAEDAVQEAYLRAFRFFSGYRGGDPKSWLLEIVRNTCFGLLKREKHAATVPIDESVAASKVHTSEPEALDGGERRIVLRNCIERLPSPFREVLVLRALEEMSYRQISDIVRLPIGTVMSRLSRARKRLEDCAAGRKIRTGK